MSLTRKPPDLSKIHILIADGDKALAEVLRQTMRSMGFSQVTYVQNGQRALRLIDQGNVDVFVTEWDMDAMDGIETVQALRDHEHSPNILMPVVMLTGKATREHVAVARDAGINEFVVKPFSSNLLFDRIRKVFDNPRDFILSEHYNGPDRRFKDTLETEAGNNRHQRPVVISSGIVKSVDTATPKLVQHDFSLRNKANLFQTITKVITPDVLDRAQGVIDSFKDSSHFWMRDDINDLEKAVKLIRQKLPGGMRLAEKASLSIKSRGGTFGYEMASNVAFNLYLFLQHDFSDTNKAHIMIVEKHIDVLKVLLTSEMLGQDAKIEQELITELFKMTDKLKSTAYSPA